MRVRGLYVIADSSQLGNARLLERVEPALRGGARIVQYRDKSADTQRRHREAQALRSLCTHYDALFIVNDDPRLAAEVGADGVHIGRADASVREVRSVMHAEAVVGCSCYDELARAVTAEEEGADYVAFGSFFPSRVKPDAVRPEVDLLQRAKRRLAVPVVAIGGVTLDNARGLVAAGADALAVITGVFAQADVEAAARALQSLYQQDDDQQ